MEQIHFYTELTMITLFCFCKHCKVIFKFIRLFKTKCINACKHRTIRITAPICTSNLIDFKCLSVNLFCICYMRTAAKVKIAVLFISCNSFAFRKVVNKFNLIVLSGKKLKCFFLRNFPADKIVITGNNAAHFFFYSRKIGFGEFGGGWKIEIIVKTVINSRTYCDFCSWVQLKDSFCHHVSTTVSDCL